MGIESAKVVVTCPGPPACLQVARLGDGTMWNWCEDYPMKLRNFATIGACALVCGCATTGRVSSSGPLASLPKLGTVHERFQSYNVEMVEITGGQFWAPYGGAADERYRQRPAENLADKRLIALAPDDSLTGLEGVPVNGRLSVPGKAIVFVAIAGANNSACR